MTNDETILVRLRAVAGRRPTCRAGPRLLTDMYLARLGIDRGYEREEYTHLAVAASVKNGAADTGLAILAAAKALDLDFIPVATERYDRHFQGVSPLCQARIEAVLAIILRSVSFRERIMALGGYDLHESGTVVYEQRAVP